MTPQTFRGKVFHVVTGTTHPAYSLETFSREENDFRDKYWDVQPGDVVFDVGASYGSYTLTALAAGAARIVSFEPEPSVFADLQRNISVNGWQGKCTALNMGLWDELARVDMKSYAPHWPAQTITGDYSMTTLDDFARDASRLDGLKIDVEGAEARALRGGRATIARCKPRVIVEVHSFLDPTLLQQCKDLLPDYEFEEVPRDECVLLVASPI